ATYTHEDRMVLAGAVPVGDQTLTLETADPLRATHFLERRELGVVNVGEPGEVLVDDQPHKLGALDGMYIGLGRRVAFRGDGARVGGAGRGGRAGRAGAGGGGGRGGGGARGRAGRPPRAPPPGAPAGGGGRRGGGGGARGRGRGARPVAGAGRRGGGAVWG